MGNIKLQQSKPDYAKLLSALYPVPPEKIYLKYKPGDNDLKPLAVLCSEITISGKLYFTSCITHQADYKNEYIEIELTSVPNC